MKFSEMPYERVDLEQLLSDIRNITEGFQTAGSAEEQISWIHKMDEMMGKVQTMERLAYIRYTINTQDPFYAAEQEHNSQTSPLIEEAMQPYYRAIVESPYRAELEQKIGKMLFVRHEFALKGFSPEITKLVQEENLLTAEYQALMGSAQIPFDGKVLNIAQMGQYTVSPDREVRKQAFEAMGRYYDSKQKELDEIFDKLVKNRTEQAKRLGYDSYVDLAYIRRERCYTVEDVRNFRKQVLEDLVPVNCRLKEAQAKRIGVDHICFYDDAYSFPDGNATPQGTPEELLAAAKEMYTEMSPETAEFIQAMFDMDLFDVLAKPGKTTGGYCDSLPVYKCPFIFANFNGTSGDVEVLTHEAGHAFASYVSSREVPYLDLHWPTMEGAETHSMSMEFLTAPWHEKFFKDQTKKYEYSHLVGTLFFIPYGCMVDHFQEIVYLHPELTPEERNQEWLKLESMYRPYLDLAGLPCYARGAGWQRQLHFYTVPYYYIDYCLAQTVALQYWMKSEESWKEAWENYLAFVKQGGKKSFVELVEDAGMVLPFTSGCLKRITDYVEKWLEGHKM